MSLLAYRYGSFEKEKYAVFVAFSKPLSSFQMLTKSLMRPTEQKQASVFRVTKTLLCKYIKSTHFNTVKKETVTKLAYQLTQRKGRKTRSFYYHD
jgi:hypothetical protein